MRTVDWDKDPLSPAFPSKAASISCPWCGQLLGRSSDLQAPYWLALPSPRPDQCSCERSFLLTAAGQFRILTGFPFHLTARGQAPW